MTSKKKNLNALFIQRYKKLIQSLYIYIEFILCVNIIIYIILLNSIIEMRINF